MPYQFEFDASHQVFRFRLEGRITDKEIRDAYRAVAAAIAKFEPNIVSGITDLSGVTSFEVSAETILELARLEPALPDQKKVRVIIAPTPLIFGMARMFEISGEPMRPNLHVVRTEQEAWAILGVWEPKFEPLEE